MLTPETEQSINAVFEKVISAYIFSASEIIALNTAEYNEESYEDYKYEMSRVMSKTEEWKKELCDILSS